MELLLILLLCLGVLGVSTTDSTDPGPVIDRSAVQPAPLAATPAPNPEAVVPEKVRAAEPDCRRGKRLPQRRDLTLPFTAPRATSSAVLDCPGGAWHE